jgi:hypothetical protein
MRKMVIVAMALVLCGAFAMSAQAFDIDFTVSQFQTGASISFAGGATPLVGTNLVITEVGGIGTPLNSGPGGVLPITNGLLNFTSGNFVAVDPSHWDFEGGGPITITGSILGSPVELLMEGTLSGARVFAPDSNNFSVVRLTFTDTKDFQYFDLLDYFGISGISTLVGSANLGFFQASPAAVPPDAFASNQVGSGDVHNLPVPPAVWLFGSGLLGLVGLRRKLKA